MQLQIKNFSAFYVQNTFCLSLPNNDPLWRIDCHGFLALYNQLWFNHIYGTCYLNVTYSIWLAEIFILVILLVLEIKLNCFCWLTISRCILCSSRINNKAVNTRNKCIQRFSYIVGQTNRMIVYVWVVRLVWTFDENL